MNSKRAPKKRASQVKIAKGQDWHAYGNLVFTSIKPRTTLTDQLLRSICEEADLHGDHLGVIIVSALDMRMNTQGRHENCVFVTKANSKRLMETLDAALDEIFNKFSARSRSRDEAISQLRNSAEILSICLNQIDSKKPQNTASGKSTAQKRRAYRYRNSGQSDPNTSYQIPDLRKYREEEEDFRGHHDHAN